MLRLTVKQWHESLVPGCIDPMLGLWYEVKVVHGMPSFYAISKQDSCVQIK